MKKIYKGRRLFCGIISTFTMLCLLFFCNNRDTTIPDQSNPYHHGVNSDNTVDFVNMSICNRECKQFKEYIQSYWPQSKPKSVIYVLSQGQRLHQLKQLLQSVDKYFNNMYNYPVVIFPERDLVKQIEYIRQHTLSKIYFQEVVFKIPENLKDPVPYNIPCVSTLGYRHMCRFQAKMVYEHKILEGLEYFWRLDDDSLLTQPIKYDLFKFMKEQHYLYGYIWKHRDAYQCVTGLWEATQRYIMMNNIQTQFFNEWRKPTIYYNNFEISSSAIWKSSKYRKYIDYIDRIGGIYYFRWGDAPIKGIAVSMFVPKNQTVLFKNIGYKHNKFQTEHLWSTIN